MFSFSLFPCSSYFSKLQLSMFPSHSLLQFWPAASLAFSDTFLSKVCCARPFTDLCRNSLDPVSQLACPDFFAEGTQAFGRERLLPWCPVWLPQVVPCSLSLMHRTGGCTSLAIYILRGLSVSICLWLWKQLYLNTECKLVFQNKRIIKMRGKKGRENTKY